MLGVRLEEFTQFNNPNRIAELRKHCATTMTGNSKSKSGGISSRLCTSSGGPRTTARHY